METSYRADFHEFALELANILALNKELPALKYGIHPLPQDLVYMGQKIDQNNSAEDLKIWLEKVAQLLDRAKPDPENWILLKRLLVALMKLPNQSEARTIFRSVFDPFRVRIWSKMHFEVIPKSFASTLFCKLFDVQNPATLEFIKIYAELAANLNVKLKRIKTETESQLNLSKNRSYHQPNFNKFLFRSIKMEREVIEYPYIQNQLVLVCHQRFLKKARWPAL